MSQTSRACVRNYGQGARSALALHCTLAHSGAWRGLAAALEPHLSLVAVDLPGHGNSPDWDVAQDFHAQCTQTAQRYLTEPMDVIGHSFGATVALRLAVEHPRMIRSLSLIEPVFFAAALADAPDQMAAHTTATTPCFRALERGDARVAARLFNRFWGDGTAWSDISELTRRYMADRMHLVPAQAGAILDDNAGLLATGALTRVQMPVLLLQGDQSPAIVDAIHTSLAARLPNVRRQEIIGAGHMAPITHPKAVANEVRALLEIA
ncbi:alpha/beta hydrolase [Roseobacter sp.]|uniref:alpha/beta fold hydrolase n=1 Tax=Roseobacter sp. TaxID=1907202 RepID=UPI003299B01B